MKLRRPDGSIVVSLAVHAVMILALGGVIVAPSTIRRIFPTVPREPVERITYARISPPPPAKPAAPARRGGDGRRGSAQTSAPPVVSPSVVPDVVSPPSATPVTTDEGSGPLIGGGGPRRGVQPRYGEPSVWLPVRPAPLPKTDVERLDSLILATVTTHADSMAVIARMRQPGDWTFERGGKKYGIGPGGPFGMAALHLGGISIPLPLSRLQAPAPVDERDRAFAAMRADLQRASQRAISEDEFRRAVQRIRERRERDRGAATPPGPGAGG